MCVWFSNICKLEGKERTVHENETRESVRLGQVFPGHLILESPGMPLSPSCTRSHSKAVPTPSSPAGVWFLLLTVTVGSRRKSPRVYMHGFPCLPTIQTRNGKENSETENHSTTKKKKVKFQESKMWLANQRWEPGIPATFSFRLLWKSGLILPCKRMKTFLEPQREKVSRQTYCLISSVFTWPWLVFLVIHIHLWLQWTKN